MLSDGTLLYRDKELNVGERNHSNSKKDIDEWWDEDPKPVSEKDVVTLSKTHNLARKKQDLYEYAKKIHNEAENDAFKALVKKQMSQREKMANASNKSNRVLVHMYSTFPFDFFPNELIVDLEKVTFVSKEFFWTGTIDAIYIKDIADVVVETGPFFSTLRIIDVIFRSERHVIKYLKKDDSFKAREIIEGLITACKEDIDISRLPYQDVIPTICRLSGKMRDVCSL